MAVFSAVDVRTAVSFAGSCSPYLPFSQEAKERGFEVYTGIMNGEPVQPKLRPAVERDYQRLTELHSRPHSRQGQIYQQWIPDSPTHDPV